MLLDVVTRPVEVFDPSNRTHRQHYADFVRTGSWGSCPVRFEIAHSEASDHNMLYIIQRKLAEYYAEREFASVNSSDKDLIIENWRKS